MRKPNQHFKLLFFTINLHFVTSDQVSTYTKQNLPLTNIIYLVQSSLQKAKRFKQTKVFRHASFSEKKRPTNL